MYEEEVILIGGAESEVDGKTVESRPDRDELIAACKGLENEHSILSSLDTELKGRQIRRVHRGLSGKVKLKDGTSMSLREWRAAATMAEYPDNINKTFTQVQDRLEDLEAEGTFKSFDHGEIASRE